MHPLPPELLLGGCPIPSPHPGCRHPDLFQVWVRPTWPCMAHTPGTCAQIPTGFPGAPQLDRGLNASGQEVRVGGREGSEGSQQANQSFQRHPVCLTKLPLFCPLVGEEGEVTERASPSLGATCVAILGHWGFCPNSVGSVTLNTRCRHGATPRQVGACLPGHTPPCSRAGAQGQAVSEAERVREPGGRACRPQVKAAQTPGCRGSPARLAGIAEAPCHVW